MFFTVQDCIQAYINNAYKDQEIKFSAKNMNESIGNQISEYAVYGYIYNNGNKQDLYFKVRLDTFNMTYEVNPYNNISSIKEIKMEENDEAIKKDGDNTFTYNRISDEKLCRIYYEEFSKLELEAPQEAYSMLNEEYKKERFATFEEYQEYINDNNESIEKGVLSQYAVNNKDNYTEYILVNTYKNTYIVEAEGIMDYTIKLDNYTIKLDDYEKNYKEMSDNGKVSTNCYKFMQMINSKDYKHAYKLLDETFKHNNFDTIEKFKNYVKEQFFKYNYYQDSFDVENKDDYYICNFNIRNSSASVAETKKLSIVMQLKEGTDFVMSFSLE